MNLAALFGGEEGSIDALSLLGRVFEQVAQELARYDGLPGLDQKPPEELLAASIGNRLARMVVDDHTAPHPRADEPARHGGGDLDDDELGYDDELVDRNLALAAALGACDCWGQDPGCRICAGAGGPGWLPPDRQLFAAYVYPAMRAVRAETAHTPRPSATNRRTTINNTPEESDHVHVPR